jgi:exodeoxyribonuclease V alpha subunit
MKYDAYQTAAITGIATSPHRFNILHGSAGRGKTTISQAIVEEYTKNGTDPASIYFAATTGKAAKVFNEALPEHYFNRPMTVHRLLGCRGPAWEYNSDNRLECKLLIVDESSMADSPLFARILYSVSSDAKVLFTGDAQQLLPVGPGSPFLDLVRHGPAGIAYGLKINYRQKEGSQIADACETILAGKKVRKPDGACTAGALYIHEEQDNELIPEQTLNIIRPWYEQGDDFALLIPQRTGKVGINEMNLYLQEKLNPGEHGQKVYDYRIKAGDMVRCTKNNYALNVFNGETGKCLASGVDGIICDFDGQTVTFEERADQLSLVLAYANTIHSSQGSEYRKGCIICDRSHTFMWDRALAYVAVSRFKDELHIVGQESTLWSAVKKNKSSVRNTLIKDELKGRRLNEPTI